MTPTINLHYIVVKCSSKPHNDLPSDMGMFAQLIVNQSILLQTVVVESAANHKSWKLVFNSKVPQQALSFLVAIMCRSPSQGVRLLGTVDINRGEVPTSVKQKTRFFSKVMKVNPDGPSLVLTAEFSISESSPAASGFNVTDFARNQGKISVAILTLSPDFQTINSLDDGMIRPSLAQMKDDTNNSVQVNSLDLWVMHERILLLSSMNKNRALFLNILGDICLKCYQTFGVVDDLNQAVCAYNDALREGLRGAKYYTDLGVALCLRFERLGDLTDINKSILMFEDVVQLTSDGHPGKPGRLSNLGNSLSCRFERLGNVSDINKSIMMQENAVQLTPDGHPDKAVMLNNLGNSLSCRFEQLGNLKDINESILILEDAVRITPDGHPGKGGRLNNLGNSLSCRFEQFGDLGDINKSILMHNDAVQLTPDGHPEKPGRLNSLGNSLFCRFERLGNPSDINRSILMFNDAVQLTPDDHPDKEAMLYNLGNVVSWHFEQLNDLSVINNCAVMPEDAVKLTPDSHCVKNQTPSSTIDTDEGTIADYTPANNSASRVADFERSGPRSPVEGNPLDPAVFLAPLRNTRVADTTSTSHLKIVPQVPPVAAVDHGEDITTRTFTIYSSNNEKPEPDNASFTTSDLSYSQAHLGIGGCLMSVHEPVEAASWIEEHWSNSLLTAVRESGYGGPLPCMLSPDEPALAIFGRLDDPIVVNMADSLTSWSGFPVVVRPYMDNPALTLLAHDVYSHNVAVPLGGSTGNDDESRSHGDEPNTFGNSTPPGDSGHGGQRDGQNLESGGSAGVNRSDDPEKYRENRESQGDGGGDGGGGGGGSTAIGGKWESPLHRTRFKLRLKPNTGPAYPITIGYTFKFTINRQTEMPIDLDDMARPLSQPEVIAFVDFQIETRPRETQVDRSYASIGFVAHRRESIIERKFLHRGFDRPDRVYKRGQNRQIQRGLKGALGFSQGSPLATAAFSYNQVNDNTLEATDDKVMPKCRVDYEIGDEWDESNKSYSSYNIAYQTQDMRLDSERSEFYPLEVRVGMGINLHPAGSEKPLPQISFVNRNQVLIWVLDPTLRARIRGIVVLMSSHLDNIRTNDKLAIYEQEQIQLNARPLPLRREDVHKPGIISLSIAQVQTNATSGSSKFGAMVPGFITKLGQRSSAAPPTYIPPHEYLARGWDINNNEWRRVLWPALDKHFRAAALERTSPIWKIQCQWDAQNTIATDTQR